MKILFVSLVALRSLSSYASLADLLRQEEVDDFLNDNSVLIKKH